MRKSWPFALAVIVVGGLAGLAIAGRPEPGDPFVLDPSFTVGQSTSSTSVDVGSSTSRPAVTTTVAATTAPTSIAPTTAASPSTTTTTTTAPPPTVPPLTSTTILGNLPRDQVRLVIANGDGRFQLASHAADRIRPLGYIIQLGEPVSPVDATVIYYRPGFDDEAAFAAIDIGVPDAIVTALPSGLPITDFDDSGDVIIVLGPDAPA